MDCAPFYRASIAQMPRLHQFKSYRVSDFFYEFEPVGSNNYCEFSFIQEGDLLETWDGATLRCPAGSVHTAVLREGLVHTSDSPAHRVLRPGSPSTCPASP